MTPADLREVLERLGWTRQQLADAIGRSLGWVAAALAEPGKAGHRRIDRTAEIAIRHVEREALAARSPACDERG